jgi:hypothetical protein
MNHRLFSFLAAALVMAASPARADSPNIRVCVRLIEVPHPALTELLAARDASGPALHAAASALIRSGKAKLIDCSIICVISGNKATAESVQERIYPTEYEPSTFGGTPDGFVPWQWTAKAVNRPFLPEAWHTRNVGMSFEIEPRFEEDQSTIHLRMLPEWVALNELVTWVEHVDEWGDASDRRPTFTSLRSDNSLPLVPGRFELAGVLTPQATAPAPRLDRKALLFVRADIPKQ